MGYVMNKLIENRFYRMATIISLLSAYNGNDNCVFSIGRLSKLLSVSEETLREDLYQISGSDNNNAIYSLEACSDDIDEIIDPRTVDKDLEIYLSGYYNSKVELILDSDEWTLLNDFLDDKLDSGIEKSKVCFFKNSLNAFSDKYIEWMNALNETIEAGSSVRFMYMDKNNQMAEVKTRPVKLIHAVDDNLIYIVGHNGYFYRFDRISGEIKNCRESFELRGDIDYSLFEKMWGAENSKEPVHVKVKIYKEAGAPGRALNELGAHADGHITEYDDYIVYEDDVIGINKFKSWVYGYGKSMVVMEPEKLREEIVASIKKRWKYYL